MRYLYKNLQTLRLNHRYTQEYVASLLGISQTSYSRIERGAVDITVSKLIKIHLLYKINFDTLFNIDIAEEQV